MCRERAVLPQKPNRYAAILADFIRKEVNADAQWRAPNEAIVDPHTDNRQRLELVDDR